MSRRLTEPPGDFRRLLRKARAGDETAWQTIYTWLAPQVLGYLKTSGVADPEDVLGNVFLKVAKQIHEFDGDARGFRAWVFTIARRRRVDDIRRRLRRPEELRDLRTHVNVPADLDVEHQAVSSVALDGLLSLLDHLTDDQREVIVLRSLGGWSTAEMAELTGRTVGSVEQLQFRATRALRKLLDEA